MPDRPTVLVFDVNETLSDMAPLAQRFADVGAPEHLAATWFASVLRDGFGLAAAGAQQDFATVARAVLRTVLAAAQVPGSLEDGVEHVMSGLTSLDVHDDVPGGVRALREQGKRLLTLTNGSGQVSEGLLDRAGIREHVELVLSVEDAGRWKPARQAYQHAARSGGVALDQMMLVAVHPWDIDGATRAGMSTAWIDRGGMPYPEHLLAPQHSAPSLEALAELLA